MSTSTRPESAGDGASTRPVRVPAVGPRLKKLLIAIFALVALLGANSVYLAGITFLNSQHAGEGVTYQNWFYLVMFLVHLVLGTMLILPVIVFGTLHMLNTRGRKNRRAIRVGYALFAVALTLLGTGVLLVRIEGVLDLRNPAARSLTYWLHVGTPLVVIWLYWLHRLAGPKIHYKLAFSYLAMVAVIVGGMIFLHGQDPRQWNVVGPQEGEQYFFPSLARTSTGNFIPAKSLANDAYCKQCHADVHAKWEDSVHKFSSFNNPAYLASIHETRQAMFKRDGNVQGSRWCAGCHDPVPFFSGAFDDPKFDMLNHATAKAGVTCTVCHAISHVNSNRGNSDYTIEEPVHYPFAFSDNSVLQWVNRQLVKAKPAFHKTTFLKPFHKTAEFCSTCHKVHLPRELNDYRDFLRGQNHYDAYLLSGVSGHGARSFYYPPKAQKNCNGCHMPLLPSDDFGAKFFADAKELSVHNHLFPTANTGVAWLRDRPEIVKAHQDFLKGTMRVDVFGVREDGSIDGKLHAPIRPSIPVLQPGKAYLLETVIRTLKLGHLFTQGTVDSNEVWLEVTATSAGKTLGQSGKINAEKGNEVDPWSHFVNVFVLDKNGFRIARRNPQDIFTVLYNHQIPPGAGQTVHYHLQVPDDVTEPITVNVKLKYRKFDREYMDFIARQNKELGQEIRGYEKDKPYRNELPITLLAEDEVTFPIAGKGTTASPREIPEWQRWNDYGIGLLLKGKAELKQTAEAFSEVEKLGRFDGPMNLARTWNAEGDLPKAIDALQRAYKFREEKGFPRWTWAWLNGWIESQEGDLEAAERDLRSVLEDTSPELQARGFDFSQDYEVLNLLGRVLLDRGNQLQRQGKRKEAEAVWREGVTEYQKTLAIDSENFTAHYNLQLLYVNLKDEEKAEYHRKLHEKYKPDENVSEAIRLARERYPAANHAAEAVVIYDLQRSAKVQRPEVGDQGSESRKP